MIISDKDRRTLQNIFHWRKFLNANDHQELTRAFAEVSKAFSYAKQIVLCCVLKTYYVEQMRLNSFLVSEPKHENVKHIHRFFFR